MSERSQRRRKRSCSKTLKQRYPTEQMARKVLLNARISRSLHANSSRREERVYQCEFCDGWHLTSQPFDPERGAA